MSDNKFPAVTTPRGTARYPRLNEPDTKGEYADNKYKTEIVLSPSDTAEFKRILREHATRMIPGLDNPGLPIRTDKKDGTVSFMFKSKNKPPIFDSTRARIPESNAPEVGPGSVIRVDANLAVYPPKGTPKGITAYISAVQLIELRERSRGAAAFDIVADGYVADKASEVVDAATVGGNRFDL